MGLNAKKNKTYATVLNSDGKIRVATTEIEYNSYVEKVKNGEQVSIEIEKRETTRTDGTTGVKYERIYDELSGFMTGIKFWKGKFGENLHVVINDGGDDIILSLSYEGKFSDNFLKKLPRIDLTKKVILKPYNFDVDEKNRKGITVIQDGVKLNSFFHDENNKPLEGTNFPVFEGEYSKNAWIIYVMQVREYLRNYLETSTELVVNFEGEEFGGINETNSSNINRGDNAEVEKLSQAKKDIDSINVEELDFEAMKKEVKANETVKVDVGITKRKIEEVAKPAVKNVPTEPVAKGALTPIGKENVIKKLVGIEDDKKATISAMNKTGLPYLPENYDEMIKILKGL